MVICGCCEVFCLVGWLGGFVFSLVVAFSFQGSSFLCTNGLWPHFQDRSSGEDWDNQKDLGGGQGERKHDLKHQNLENMKTGVLFTPQ